MATCTENKQFAESVLVQYPLDDAIEWIKSNLPPEDVFDEETLASWALDNGFIKADE